MDRTALLARFDHERRTHRWAGQSIETLPRVTRVIGMNDAYRIIHGLALDDANADAAIEEEIAAAPGDFHWKIYAHDRPPDLLDRLKKRGFRIDGQAELMAFDLAEEPQWVADSVAFEVRRIDRVVELGDFRAVTDEVFGRPFEATANELAAAIEAGSENHRAYVAYADGVPAGAGRLSTDPESWFGVLISGGVREAYRGRGIYRALVAARAKDARAHGAKALLIDALPTSEPILRRLGFDRLATSWLGAWIPNPSPLEGEGL